MGSDVLVVDQLSEIDVEGDRCSAIEEEVHLNAVARPDAEACTLTARSLLSTTRSRRVPLSASRSTSISGPRELTTSPSSNTHRLRAVGVVEGPTESSSCDLIVHDSTIAMRAAERNGLTERRHWLDAVRQAIQVVL